MLEEASRALAGARVARVTNPPRGEERLEEPLNGGDCERRLQMLGARMFCCLRPPAITPRQKVAADSDCQSPRSLMRNATSKPRFIPIGE
jgi:hypothetical protein